MQTFEALQGEYTRLWDTMRVRIEKDTAVDLIANKLWKHYDTYKATEKMTGVPWYVVAAWHNRESDANFNTQLAQGDPLHSVSRHVPSGRGPFKTWQDGAYDALVVLKHLDRVKDWTPARICYETERYNGFGYRDHHPSVLSPYLWAWTTHYHQGKYVADGQFSATAVDSQCGAIPIMKWLIEIEARHQSKPAPMAEAKPWWKRIFGG